MIILQVSSADKASADGFVSDPISHTESFFFIGTDPYAGGFFVPSETSIPVSGYAEAELEFFDPYFINVDINASQFVIPGLHSRTITSPIGEVDMVFEDVGFSMELSSLYLPNTGPGYTAIQAPGSPPPSVIANRGRLSLVNATGVYQPVVGDGFTLDFDESPQAAVGIFIGNNSDAGMTGGDEYFRFGDLWIYLEILPYNERFIYAGFTPDITFQAVPEPSAAWMMALGGILVLMSLKKLNG